MDKLAKFFFVKSMRAKKMWITREDLVRKIEALEERLEERAKEVVLLKLERDGNRQVLEMILDRIPPGERREYLKKYEANKNA